MTETREPCSAATFETVGPCPKQVAHHGAQNHSTTGLPARLAPWKGLPSRVSPSNASVAATEPAGFSAAAPPPSEPRPEPPDSPPQDTVLHSRAAARSAASTGRDRMPQRTTRARVRFTHGGSHALGANDVDALRAHPRGHVLHAGGAERVRGGRVAGLLARLLRRAGGSAGRDRSGPGYRLVLRLRAAHGDPRHPRRVVPGHARASAG